MKTSIIILAVLFMNYFTSAQISKYKADLKKSGLQWTGKKVTGEHTGNINLKMGELDFLKGKISGGKFEIDMLSITCTDIKDEGYNKKLIGHLKSEDFFSVEKNPVASFVIKEAKTNDGKNYNIIGDLTIKGITKPIEFKAILDKEKEIWTSSAEIKVNRALYDIKYGSGSFFQGLGDNLIYDDFEIKVKLVIAAK